MVRVARADACGACGACLRVFVCLRVLVCVVGEEKGGEEMVGEPNIFSDRRREEQDRNLIEYKFIRIREMYLSSALLQYPVQ